MAAELDLVARLLAHESGRAVAISTHRLIAIQPNALVLCPVAMAGEDTTVHAVAVGGIGCPPEIFCVPDPRIRDSQYDLFVWLGTRIERHFEASRRAGEYAQIWVSSSPTADHLDTLADRLRYNRENAAVKRFGELLSFQTERYPIAGQQALVTATGALRKHWATGQQPGEDEHLGALLTWIEPPPNVDVLRAVALAERVPMGVKTDPEFDRDILEKRVAAYNEARRANAGAADLRRRADLIQQALEPVVRVIYDGTQRAIGILLAMNLPPLTGLQNLEDRERDEFASFMASRDAGYHLPVTDKPRPAAFKLTAREDAAKNVEAAVLCGDGVGRARARLAGHTVYGRIENPQCTRVGMRRFRNTFDLLSRQRVLRVRRRDELTSLEDARLQVTVTEVHREGMVTRISVVIVHGQRAVGLPAPGTTLEMAKTVPDWDGLIRTRKQLRDRLGVTPWTHAEEGTPPPAARRRRPPRDPLADLEALR
jgi:hypothetical protein